MRVLYSVLVAVLGGLVLVACETEGRITDFLPTQLFRDYDSRSAYPNINDVPEQPDPRLEALVQFDPQIGQWRDELERNRQALGQREQPKKRIHDDPDWPVDGPL